MSFLDVITYNSNGRINSTPFVKPTDTHSYLDYRSCHLQNNKSSIPYSQFLRIRRNCTEWTEFIRHSIKLYIYFSQCGYPPELVTPSLLRVNKCSQAEALSNSRNSTKENNSLFCIIKYNPTNPSIQEWIKELWPALYRSSDTKSLIDQDIVFGYREPKSLQDILVHTNIFGNSNKKKNTHRV